MLLFGAVEQAPGLFLPGRPPASLSFRPSCHFLSFVKKTFRSSQPGRAKFAGRSSFSYDVGPYRYLYPLPGVGVFAETKIFPISLSTEGIPPEGGSFFAGAAPAGLLFAAQSPPHIFSLRSNKRGPRAKSSRFRSGFHPGGAGWNTNRRGPFPARHDLAYPPHIISLHSMMRGPRQSSIGGAPGPRAL